MKPLINLYWTYPCLEPGRELRMELISPHSSPLACQQPPQSVASTKMTTVSLVPQNPQPVIGSRPSLKIPQMTLKIQPSTVKARANLSPNSSTEWSKGSQDPAGSAGSPEIISGHTPQPSDPRPGKESPYPQPRRNIPGVSQHRTGHGPQGQVRSRCSTSLSQIGH